MTKKRIRVVIVEDNEATAYLIKKAFSNRVETVDWDLCFAKDGEEALDCLFRRGPYAESALPDFVLLDWNLPKVSGRYPCGQPLILTMSGPPGGRERRHLA